MRSPERSYWRLTSLEEFDGTHLVVERQLRRRRTARCPRPSRPTWPPRPSSSRSRSRPSPRSGCPTAYEPRALDAPGVEVRYDEESATLIVDNDITTQRRPHLPGRRRPRPGITPDDLSRRGERGPRRHPRPLPRSARRASARRCASWPRRSPPTPTTPAEQARALQDHLRTFTYSLEVQRGHSEDALEDFLFTTQTGYCEQFAGAFAAMARSIGLPARVAVGFTPGDEDPDEPGLYHVRGEYAHAWPEVYIAGAGWVLYEPTPGRGAPNAEGYTGVPEQQAVAGDPAGSVTAPSTATTRSDPLGDADQPRRAQSRARSRRRHHRPHRRRLRLRADALPRRSRSPRPRRSSPSSSLGYALLFPLGLLLGRGVRRRRARHAVGSDRAGVDGDGRGRGARRLRGAAERHLLRARPPPGGRARRGRARRLHAGPLPRGRGVLSRGRQRRRRERGPRRGRGAPSGGEGRTPRGCARIRPLVRPALARARLAPGPHRPAATHHPHRARRPRAGARARGERATGADAPPATPRRRCGTARACGRVRHRWRRGSRRP